MGIRITLFSVLTALVALVWLQADANAAKENFQRTKPHLSIAASSPDLDLAGFDRMSGLGVEVEITESETGGVRVTGTPGDITLKRGYTGATDVNEWAAEALRGAITLRRVEIHVLGPSAEPMRRFKFAECFPTRWDLSTDELGHAVETIVVKCGLVDLD